MFQNDTTVAGKGVNFNFLYVWIKYHRGDKAGRKIISWQPIKVEAAKVIQEDDALEYMFINLGNNVAFINDYPLFPCIFGIGQQVSNPINDPNINQIDGVAGVLKLHNNLDEFDNTVYNIVFKNMSNFFDNITDFTSAQVFP